MTSLIGASCSTIFGLPKVHPSLHPAVSFRTVTTLNLDGNPCLRAQTSATRASLAETLPASNPARTVCVDQRSDEPAAGAGGSATIERFGIRTAGQSEMGIGLQTERHGRRALRAGADSLRESSKKRAPVANRRRQTELLRRWCRYAAGTLMRTTTAETRRAILEPPSRSSAGNALIRQPATLVQPRHRHIRYHITIHLDDAATTTTTGRNRRWTMEPATAAASGKDHGDTVTWQRRSISRPASCRCHCLDRSIAAGSGCTRSALWTERFRRTGGFRRG